MKKQVSPDKGKLQILARIESDDLMVVMRDANKCGTESVDEVLKGIGR
jgi:hypothetical protein